MTVPIKTIDAMITFVAKTRTTRKSYQEEGWLQAQSLQEEECDVSRLKSYCTNVLLAHLTKVRR
jgi:hypothetical protein